MKLSVIGQGYVGLPLAIAGAAAGHEVTGIDTDNSLISKLLAGQSTIGDLSHKQIEQALASRNYLPSISFEAVKISEIVVVCVPTPLTEDRQPDFSFLKSAVQSVAENLKHGALVIIESTVSPGSTREIVAKILDKTGIEYDLAYSPERIDPANKKWNVTNTPKLVAGLSIQATNRASEFYKSFVSSVITGSSVEVIETAKLLENSFRLINISFINEVADFCSKMNIDVREVIDAAATKPYGFMPFYPGVGVGGHCIPVDPSYLVAKAKEIGATTSFIDLANEVNLALPSYFAGVASGMLGGLAGKKILIVGVAYKPDVSDTRETPALEIIRVLRKAGATVSWHDELVGNWLGETSVALSNEYDLAILANVHTGTNLSKLGSMLVLDTRGHYS